MGDRPSQQLPNADLAHARVNAVTRAIRDRMGYSLYGRMQLSHTGRTRSMHPDRLANGGHTPRLLTAIPL